MLVKGAALAALANIALVNATYEHLTFEPSPPFEDVWDVLLDQRRILLRAANRIGKTRHCAWLAAKKMIEEPGCRVRVVGPTAAHIHNVLGEYLAEFLKPYLKKGSYYVTGKGWNGGRARTIILRNGSICELRALSDDVDAHSGTSQHLIIFDEPPTLAHYLENLARLGDTGGTLIIAATMVNRPVEWLREMVQGKGQPDAEIGFTVHKTGWLQVVIEYSAENCPWYTDEQIAQHLEGMESSPWQYGQRVKGGWSGVTLERLFVGINERNFTLEPPAGDFNVGLAFDHGEVAGHQAVVLFAYNKTRIYALDEYVNAVATSPEDDAGEVLNMLARHNIKPTDVDLAVGDINTATGYTGWRINQVLQKAFAEQTHKKAPPFMILDPDKSPGSVDWGLRCINFAGRRGDLTIHKRCVHLGKSLRHWKGGKNGEDGKLVHIVDALRYFVTSAVGHMSTYARLRFD